MTKFDDAVLRSTTIAERLRQRTDERLRATIAQLPEMNYHPLDGLMISERAWAHVESCRLPPQLVFAHPLTLRDHPQTSQYYRGISLLPQKRVHELARSVAAWESGDHKSPLNLTDCMNVARLYNAVISTTWPTRVRRGTTSSMRCFTTS